MRLAILGSRGFPSTYGGYETLVRHLAPFLVSAGHDVTVYCRSPREESKARRWVEDGVNCIATHGLDSKSLSTLTFGFTATLDAAFRRFDAMLVLNIANGFWLPLLRASKTPVAVNTDGIEWERGKWNRLGQSIFKAGAWLTARTATELVCDSVAIGDIWSANFGRSSIFIPYGAPILRDVGHSKLANYPLTEQGYLLVVARLAPENNVELTLDALDLLGGSAPPAIIVGSANFAAPIEARLKSMEDRGRLTWLGHVHDQLLLSQLWANCSVYVHGHSVGGTNPALLQALGAGAPTLALDTPFNREVLHSADQCFSNNASDLAEKIRTVLTTPGIQSDMRTRGQNVIRNHYSWNDVCQRYTQLLKCLGTSR